VLRINQTSLIRHTQNPKFQNKTLISVVIPVYNQYFIIDKVLDGILKGISSDYEIIVVDDGSNDGTTNSLLLYAIDFYKNSNLISFKVYRNRISKFESNCVDFGIRNSQSNYCMDIQADMELNDPGFDIRMIKALHTNDSIVAVSGRGIQNLDSEILKFKSSLGSDIVATDRVWKFIIKRIIYHLTKVFDFFRNKKYQKFAQDKQDYPYNTFTEKSDEEFLNSGVAGRISKLIEFKVTDSQINLNKIYIGDTFMRGPILFDRQKYYSIGGLDTKRFFQGYDDHDFCGRALLNNYLVGYTPVRFASPLNLGTARKKRSLFTDILILFNIIKRIRKRKSSTLYGTSLENYLKTRKEPFRKILIYK
jgi:glycosyltransferase involved in cell wall biosynthesis